MIHLASEGGRAGKAVEMSHVCETDDPHANSSSSGSGSGRGEDRIWLVRPEGGLSLSCPFLSSCCDARHRGERAV